MSPTVMMNIRMDSDLKSTIDAAAKRRGMSMTEYVTRAVRNYTPSHCGSCGWSSERNTMPAGFTARFEQLVEEHREGNVNQRYVIFTEEAGTRRVYWAAFDPSRGMDGAVMVRAMVTDLIREAEYLPIPRGVITGWTSDPDGRLYAILKTVGGYEDGNVPARKLAELKRGLG